MSELHWLLCLQSGPFDISGPDFDELDRAMSLLFVEVPELEGTNVNLWRPGVLPRYARIIVQDEWSYYTGLRGPEGSAAAAAVSIWGGGPWAPGAAEQFARLDALAEMHVVGISHDCFEVYCRDPEWLDRLEACGAWTRIDSKARRSPWEDC